MNSVRAIVAVANPAAQTFSISNMGGGTLSWAASDNADWLTLNQARGSGAGVEAVSVGRVPTATGAYNGSITLTAVGASPVTVPVTLTVTSAPASPPDTTPHRRSHHRRHH